MFKDFIRCLERATVKNLDVLPFHPFNLYSGKDTVIFCNRYIHHFLYTLSLTSRQQNLNFFIASVNRLYLDLHLEVRLEVGEQSEENGERQFEDLRHRGDSVLGQGHTQVLLDGVDEHLISLENGPGVLQDGQEQLEGQDLRSQLMGPGAGARLEEGSGSVSMYVR